jgi:hypothetical protein
MMLFLLSAALSFFEPQMEYQTGCYEAAKQKYLQIDVVELSQEEKGLLYFNVATCHAALDEEKEAWILYETLLLSDVPSYLTTRVAENASWLALKREDPLWAWQAKQLEQRAESAQCEWTRLKGGECEVSLPDLPVPSEIPVETGETPLDTLIEFEKNLLHMFLKRPIGEFLQEKQGFELSLFLKRDEELFDSALQFLKLEQSRNFQEKPLSPNQWRDLLSQFELAKIKAREVSRLNLAKARLFAEIIAPTEAVIEMLEKVKRLLKDIEGYVSLDEKQSGIQLIQTFDDPKLKKAAKKIPKGW